MLCQRKLNDYTVWEWAEYVPEVFNVILCLGKLYSRGESPSVHVGLGRGSPIHICK